VARRGALVNQLLAQRHHLRIQTCNSNGQERAHSSSTHIRHLHPTPILKPYLVIRDTQCSCEAYGMRPTYKGKITGPPFHRHSHNHIVLALKL
jgi:hypothetical protein